MQQSGTNKRRYINLLLFIVVLLLSWLVYLQLQKDQRGPDTLYSDKVGDLMRSISIKLPDQPIISMQADGADWLITQPVKAKASTKALQQLTTLLAEPIQAEYSSAGKQLEDFGLGDSAIRVRFNEVEYALGKLNPVNHYRYVLVDERILLVNEVVYELLGRGINGFIEE
ncbi:DUF4340 domain-containing protein [Leucothrix pacifica]|uniref:DUF4340 domain-containing protein n=1 Tax=Leucothrix pacifica TaxID=1247513 RepID=A0A317CQS0_9GAMM|nr:DUF4340 domain-containing protein [Leucothrix pacifica]PWR00452.1 hypothetical protein DKW60_01105 [Leucothrix pacifica]